MRDRRMDVRKQVNLMPQTPSGEGNTLTITIKLQKGIGT